MAVMSARPKVAVKNIVVATDFSPAAEVTLQYAAAIARHYESRIYLVHGIELPGHETPHATTLWGHETEAEAKEKLQQETEKCSGIECLPRLLKGTPVDVVERILALDELDLVVVGFHGAKGFHKLAVGSAAEYFFRHVRCPLLAVGPSVKGGKAVWEPKHVLLTTDLQSNEAVAARCAVLLAREHNARLVLLHVAAPARAPYPEEQHLIDRPYFQSRLKELLSYKQDYPAEFLIEFGDDAGAEILRVAGERACDLIVLSVHREEPWGLHLVHQAYRIVAEAPCPVLITQRVRG